MTVHPEDGDVKAKEYRDGYAARRNNLCTFEEAQTKSGKFIQGWLHADADERARQGFSVTPGQGNPFFPPPPPRQQFRNGLGTAGMVLGIVGVALGAWLWTWWLGGVLSILALIFGLVGRGRAKRGEANNKGMATAGVWLGSVGIALSIIGFSLFLSWVNAVDEAFDDIPTEEEIIEDWGDSLDDIELDMYNDCVDAVPLDMPTDEFIAEMEACEFWLE